MNSLNSRYSDFHDAELTGVDRILMENKVVLSFKLVDGSKDFVVLEGVRSIRLCDFINQNVVSRLFYLSGSEFIDSDFDGAVEWLYTLSDGTRLITDKAMTEMKTNIRGGQLKLFVLEPSWGAELVCLCESISLND